MMANLIIMVGIGGWVALAFAVFGVIAWVFNKDSEA
jgi:hypothetical protein